MYSELLSEFGIDVNKSDTKKSEDAVAYIDEMGEDIKEFISLTSERHKRKVQVITDIMYYELMNMSDKKVKI